MELILKLPHTKGNGITTDQESVSFSFHPHMQKTSSLRKLDESIHE